MPRVLIVAEHDAAEALADALRERGAAATVPNTPAEACIAVEVLRPELVAVELPTDAGDLPGLLDLSVAARVADARLALLTSRPSENAATCARLLGAVGCLDSRDGDELTADRLLALVPKEWRRSA